MSPQLSLPDAWPLSHGRELLPHQGQIGNAVPVETARALCGEMLSQIMRRW